MKKSIVLMIVIFAFILTFIGCKKTAAPTMPNPDGPMMTVTEIIKISDSARATQTQEAACTSTALAALFTQTATMTITPTATITITATRTVTATVTCTATPVYLVYDPLVNASAPDPAKWDVQDGGTESSAQVSSGVMNITAKTSTPGTIVAFNVISKCIDGTKAFKGSIISHSFTSRTAYDYGVFDISIGNTMDGYTLIFHETISGSEFEGGFISFEYKHISGSNYTYSINGKTPQSHSFAHQPQVKLSLTASLFSNYSGAYAQSVFKVKDVYYY